jgi:hypothetical protein
VQRSALEKEACQLKGDAEIFKPWDFFLLPQNCVCNLYHTCYVVSWNRWVVNQKKIDKRCKPKLYFQQGCPWTRMNNLILFCYLVKYLSLFISQSALKMYSKSNFHPLLYTPDLIFFVLRKHEQLILSKRTKFKLMSLLCARRITNVHDYKLFILPPWLWLSEVMKHIC